MSEMSRATTQKTREAKYYKGIIPPIYWMINLKNEFNHPQPKPTP